MKQMSQPGYHPEAAILNAFVEHVLLEPERRVVLTHLASCHRCRQIVYLAQDAAYDAEPIASSPFARQRQPLLSSWRWAWIPATALAAMIALVVSLQLRHKAPDHTEIAKTLPVPRTFIDPITDAHRKSGVAEPLVHPIGKEPPAAGGSVPFHEKAEGIHSHFLPPGAPVVGPDRPISPIAGQVPPWRGEASAPGRWMNQKLPLAADKTLPVADGEDWNPRASAKASGSPQGAIEAKAAPRAAGSIYANVMMSSAPGPDAAVARHGQYTRLPTGRPAVSTAANQHHLLAVDSSGALFLSEDGGKVWAPVTRQWTGRAIEVRVPEIAPPAEARAQANAGFLRGSPSPPASVTLFQIVNDADAVWTSADGKTWKAK